MNSNKAQEILDLAFQEGGRTEAYEVMVRELRAVANSPQVDSAVNETCGQIVDKAENFLALTKMPLSPAIQIDGLKTGMAEIRDIAKAAYLESGGFNHWGDQP